MEPSPVTFCLNPTCNRYQGHPGMCSDWRPTTSDPQSAYVLSPEAAGTEPAGFDSDTEAAPPLAGAAGEGETVAVSPTAEMRAKLKHLAELAQGEDPSGPWSDVASVALYAELPSSLVLGLLSDVEQLEADLASARARLQEETRAAAEARERAAELMAGLLMEWMDETEPHSLTYDNPDEFLKDQGVHRKFFQLKAAACGLGWPLHEATIGISAALPLVGEEGKEGDRG